MIFPPDARRWHKAADLPDSVRVEIDCEVLARLMAGQPLGAADLHCLDSDSKRLLWRICLESCRPQSCRLQGRDDPSPSAGPARCGLGQRRRRGL